MAGPSRPCRARLDATSSTHRSGTLGEQVQEGVGGWGLHTPVQAVQQDALHAQKVLRLWGDCRGQVAQQKQVRKGWRQSVTMVHGVTSVVHGQAAVPD